jgi:Uma2 family endonuclease
MAAILDLPEVRDRLSRISVEEYHRLDELNKHGRRTELIRGLVIEKMSKTPLHRLITSLLYKHISAVLPPGYSVWKEEPMALRDSEPEPDLSVTLGTEADFSAAHPSTAELVIEVAVSSPELDRVNASLYAEAGVKEYWIVLGVAKQVEVYRKPQAGKYSERDTVDLDATLECNAIPSIVIRVADMFMQ